MKYFRNVEVAQLYSVSEKSVRNWIKQSREFKNDLDLCESSSGKFYIADTTKNDLIMKSLSSLGKKYHNSRSHKLIKPTEEFYTYFKDEYIADIVGSLTRFNELPYHYCHIGPALNDIVAYYERLRKESSVVRNSQSYALEFLSGNKFDIGGVNSLNIIELGSRTGRTLDTFIKDLHAKKILNEYIAVDMSPTLLNEAVSYIGAYLGDISKVKAYERDLLNGRLDDVVIKHTNEGTINIVCLIGGILNGFNDMSLALKTIRTSILPKDYFIVSAKLDSESSRRYFDFSPQFVNEPLAKDKSVLIDLIGFDRSLYDVEQYFDAKEFARKIQVRLKFDVTLKVKVYGSEKVLHFKKGDTILLWRTWHQTLDTMMQELRDNGFKIVQAATSPDEQYGIVISKIQTDKINHR